MLTETQKKVLKFLSDTFKESNIEFQITGGLAAIAYGAHRSLYDIDIDIYKKDAEMIRGLLKQYIVEDWNNDLEGDEDNFDIWMMSLEIEGVPIDISQIEECRFRAIGGEWIAQPEVMKVENLFVGDLQLPIQNKQDLIQYKSIVARDVDLEDIRQIN